MDYIFYYSGELPKHVLTSLNAVLSVEDDSKIYFCGSDNSKLDHDRVTFINSEYFFDSHYINKIEELEKFERLDNNPLWKTSLQRIFYLYEIANHFNIDKFIHFDNDVIVFNESNISTFICFRRNMSYYKTMCPTRESTVCYQCHMFT